MQSTTGCKINVSQPQQPDIQRQIGLVGTPAAIEEARRAIYDKVDTVVRIPSLVLVISSNTIPATT